MDCIYTADSSSLNPELGDNNKNDTLIYTQRLDCKTKSLPLSKEGLGWIVYMSGTAASSRRIRGFGYNNKNNPLIYTQRLDS